MVTHKKGSLRKPNPKEKGAGTESEAKPLNWIRLSSHISKNEICQVKFSFCFLKCVPVFPLSFAV